MDWRSWCLQPCLFFIICLAGPLVGWHAEFTSRSFPVMLYAFILTGSRSGMVGLLVIVAIFVWRSRHRAALIAGSGVAAVLLVGVMSAEMKDRYLSLTVDNTRNAATRVGRIQHMQDEIKVAKRRPIFGHGLGTSGEALANFASRDQPSHNLYLEVLLELGVIGLAIFLLLLQSIVGNVRQVRAALAAVSAADGNCRAVHENYYNRCASALFAWIVMCLVFSLASYGLTEMYRYVVGGLSVALRNLIVNSVKTASTVNLPVGQAIRTRSGAFGQRRKPGRDGAYLISLPAVALSAR